MYSLKQSIWFKTRLQLILLKSGITASGLPVRRFFNTSGMKYRELGLKEKVPTLSNEEAATLLATDGMLIKRPLLISEDRF